MAIGKSPLPNEPIAARAWLSMALGPALEKRVGASVAVSIVDTIDRTLARAAGSTPTARPENRAPQFDRRGYSWSPVVHSEIRALKRRGRTAPATPEICVVLSTDPHLIGDLERRLGRRANLRYARTPSDCLARLTRAAQPRALVFDARESDDDVNWFDFPGDVYVLLRGGSDRMTEALESSGLPWMQCPAAATVDDLAKTYRAWLGDENPTGARVRRAG